jgi:hypothetical protein
MGKSIRDEGIECKIPETQKALASNNLLSLITATSCKKDQWKIFLSWLFAESCYDVKRIINRYVMKGNG